MLKIQGWKCSLIGNEGNQFLNKKYLAIFHNPSSPSLKRRFQMLNARLVTSNNYVLSALYFYATATRARTQISAHNAAYRISQRESEIHTQSEINAVQPWMLIWQRNERIVQQLCVLNKSEIFDRRVIHKTELRCALCGGAHTFRALIFRSTTRAK